ncbi:Solute carrier family 2, facilitated glucose transporter member 1 [Folsomia candida]|uniref:Solute carrier family 2, facilitated glucose transporter member 1 n=1 Tax=Folsomia candida TaxID=158441 RepID=A0A226EB05_FOLCA|nr:Solute carrier family 2, facilitated glucose transporter member 1 [Folsomia candida]
MSRITGNLILAIASAVIGSSFQCGYNIGVINAPHDLISQFINGTNFERSGQHMKYHQITLIWSWITSIFSLGVFFGILFTCLVADKLGRKQGLLWNNVLVIIAVILEGFSETCGSYEMLIIGRFLLGVNAGCHNASDLTWLRGTIEVHGELDEMRTEYEQMRSMPTLTLKEMLSSHALRTPLIITCMMTLAQQLCGINAVLFFSTKIFTAAGLDENSARGATLGMGICNIVVTLVSAGMVEKVGRRGLMLFGLSGMFMDISLLFFCTWFKEIRWVSYASVFLVIFFVVMFASGPASIPGFLSAELFGQRARPMGISIILAVNWIANLIVGSTFLPILGLMDSYVFSLFAGLLGIFIAFTYFKVPETRGKTVEEIGALFRRRDSMQ